MIEVSDSFFFPFFLGIRSPSSDTVIVEQLQSSRADLFVLIVISVGSCYSIFLSSELANDKYHFLVSSFTMCSVSVFEEDPDLSN